MNHTILVQLFSPHNLIWVSMFLYTLSFVPQIWENYKRKSGTGLSDYFLLAYLNTYIAIIYYIFCLNLPIAYKVACLLQIIATLILIGQRLYYNHSSESRFLKKIYVANILGACIFVPFALMCATLLGHFLGWISLVLTLLNQLPQVIKIIQSKSVVGFSFMFVLIMAIAAGAEFYAAIKLDLPMQTILSAARGLVFFIIFSSLFLKYRE